MIVYFLLVLLAALAGFLLPGGMLGAGCGRWCAAAACGGTVAAGVLVAGLLTRLSRRRILFFFLGLAAGKLLALLLQGPLTMLVSPALVPAAGLGILLDLFCAAGAVIYLLRLEDRLGQLQFSGLPSSTAVRKESGSGCKILDTSVIIDGRIADIAETGFLEGVLVVPQFVLLELQQIADSSDSIKRGRGRRGLDILNRMKRSGRCVVKISDTDFPEIPEVDSKLIELCKQTGGFIITNDFNLNKVAELQGVRVLNINLLTNALKPSVLPGEEMEVSIIKEGKDPNQGIAYLEDGTMIVVDNGRRFLNKKVQVAVTSVFQTPAGRMIFTEPL